MACVIGTAGHIDHGKTALVRALTGIDTDRLEQEKKRGVSIELGFAYMDLAGGSIRAAVVDVPGHERFIRNMLAGITGIDMVLFCVAADDGIMPQTREHLDIVNLLGVDRGLFVITKADLATAEAIRTLTGEIETLVKGTTLEGSPVCAVSIVTSDGIDRLKDLISRICSEPARDHDDRSGFLRLPLDRAFSLKGFGTVVTGTVASGTVAVGDEVVVYPQATRVRVRGIESHYRKVERATSGERAALNVVGMGGVDFKKGSMLLDSSLAALSGGIKIVDCLLNFTSRAGSGKRRIKNNAKLKLHHLASDTLVTVRFAKETGPGGPRGDGVSYARLFLKAPLMVLRGDRFILRDPSIRSTVGGGRVLAAYPSKRFVPKADKGFYSVLDTGAVAEILDALYGAGHVSVDASAAALILNLSPDRLADVLKGVGYSLTIAGAGTAVKRSAYAIMKESLVRIVKRYHEEHPGEPGISEVETRKRIREESPEFFPPMAGSGPEAALKACIEELTAEGTLKRDGRFIAAPRHAAATRGEDARIEEALLERIARGFAATKKEDLLKLPFKGPDVERVLEGLVRRGVIVRLKQNVYITVEAVKDAKERLAQEVLDSGSIKAGVFRDKLGCGRKLAIEILEYFDNEKITLRSGDVRTMRG